ncbi:MAG: hypothetical protein UU14_C0045G0004 [Candidatus Roizmanbacteria bacterium GW2011_GWB1_40_7]|uniref:Uncharacterized protein n=1 Tax=Candidatus Roizmanbacteria bacterium GW2011_GWB1_40_7 TaxID=1618482 RepID=A0A0G0T7L2_9BACT|nr:MAG: hypothetical protein US43_C0021G0020 [Candidatus Levybacteria bacterium GW2011_GWA1_37_16]KKR70741.1 MAG: hypothetical protein UU14_C0045G0004 [Candidatus Roizmanbacteria bacterium GW2011_GWB1_40_7]
MSGEAGLEKQDALRVDLSTARDKTESLVQSKPELPVPKEIKEILDQGALEIQFNLSDKSIIKELGLSKDINKGYGVHLSRNCPQSIWGLGGGLESLEYQIA